MAIKIKTDPVKAQTRVQFVLADDVHRGPVSAVGNFNDWKPGAHKLVQRQNGTRSVTVAVPTGQELHFRYLGAGGVWFDDPDVDEVRAEGGLLRV